MDLIRLFLVGKFLNMLVFHIAQHFSIAVLWKQADIQTSLVSDLRNSTVQALFQQADQVPIKRKILPHFASRYQPKPLSLCSIQFFKIQFWGNVQTDFKNYQLTSQVNFYDLSFLKPFIIFFANREIVFTSNNIMCVSKRHQREFGL